MNEASLFAKYLGVKTPDNALLEQYCRGIKILNLELSANEKKALNTILRFPFLLAFADGGFAITPGGKMIRRRLLLMAALIETDKKYVSQFINDKDCTAPLLKLTGSVILAGIKGVAGFILLTLFRWR